MREELKSAASPANPWRILKDDPPPLAEMVWFWHPIWLHAFPGQFGGSDIGEVWIDTCEAQARGRSDIATHWMPMSKPTESISGGQHG